MLDEQYSCAIAQELRRRDVDAVAIQRERPDLEGQDDEAVLRTATRERRVVVTNNVRDFARLVEEIGLRGGTHFGVIFTDDATFPRTHAGTGLIVRALAALVEGAQDDDLQDSCLYLPRPSAPSTCRRIRSSRRPMRRSRVRT